MVHRSITVWCDKTPYKTLPADIRNSLSSIDAVVYQTGSDYFRQRAAASEYQPLRKFFRMLAAAKNVRLHLYGGLLPKYQVYFGINLLSIGRYVQVRMGSATLPGNPPAALTQIYQDINGTIDGYEDGGGWQPAEEVKSVSAHQWQPSTLNGLDPEVSVPLYSFGNGDYAGFAGTRKGFMYTHEDGGKLEPYPIIDWAKRYFGEYAKTFGK